MTSIGIDKHNGLVYEGDSGYGRVVWPTPVVTPAVFISDPDGVLSADRPDSPFGYRFREDFYDPVSRIRRGRFYIADGSQPREWFIQPHPAMLAETKDNKHDVRKSLETCGRCSVWHKYLKDAKEQPLVLLGTDSRFTIWTIINIEVISTGEEFVTMKARNSLGVLPRLDMEKIPEGFRTRVVQSLDAFRDEVFRSGPVSVIDRARDAATQILLAHFNLDGAASKDLGDLIKLFEGEKVVVIQSAAKIIARFHARAKPVERQKHGLRAIREQDAELATQCLGTILCELRWADWA